MCCRLCRVCGFDWASCRIVCVSLIVLFLFSCVVDCAVLCCRFCKVCVFDCANCHTVCVFSICAVFACLRLCCFFPVSLRLCRVCVFDWASWHIVCVFSIVLFHFFFVLPIVQSSRFGLGLLSHSLCVYDCAVFVFLCCRLCCFVL